ncbi:RNA polymerase sigma factor [Kibdelosporangium lantanae]|uniref:RNA polymerase sigma factor n=1 Tax=Kibdelosporangium lantanae TaxID=1497396 RepID=A0ABW3M6R4_9PSEU
MSDSRDRDNAAGRPPEQRMASTANTEPQGDSVHETDTAEFERFYREMMKPLVSFLIVQGATVTEAADAAQDTMIKAFRKWHNITHPRAWIYRVASRTFIRLRVDHPETPVDPPPHPPVLRGSAIDGWELHYDLVRALSHLPSRQRQVMAWTLAGYAPAEIADELCLPAPTVRQHLYLARHALSARLTREEETRP